VSGGGINGAGLDSLQWGTVAGDRGVYPNGAAVGIAAGAWGLVPTQAPISIAIYCTTNNSGGGTLISTWHYGSGSDKNCWRIDKWDASYAAYVRTGATTSKSQSVDMNAAGFGPGWVIVTVAGDGALRMYARNTDFNVSGGNSGDPGGGSTPGPLFIGCGQSSGSFYAPATAPLRHVLIWNRVISPREVKVLRADPWAVYRPSRRTVGRFGSGAAAAFAPWLPTLLSRRRAS